MMKKYPTGKYEKCTYCDNISFLEKSITNRPICAEHSRQEAGLMIAGVCEECRETPLKGLKK